MTDRRWRAAILALALVAAPAGAAGQTPSKIPRIGVLSDLSADDRFLAAFRQGLLDLGYTEGRNIVIEYRHAQGAIDRMPVLASELVARDVDVLVVGGSAAARAARAKTATVPIVFTLVGDPVGSGLVATLGRPGGNVTGVSNVMHDLIAKQLQLLKATVPQATRVTVLHNPGSPLARRSLSEIRDAARALSIELQILEVRKAGDLAPAFTALRGWRPGAVFPLSDPVFGNELARIAAMAVKERLPALYLRREFAESGGLLAYGPSFTENFRRAAAYVDKILKGAKPADLPVEQPTKFELVINARTARALGLAIPPAVLARADEVID